ncbi:unnamed protein product [Tuber aestivum]|uniref:Uncharacterized protein n=1 Tax=Tuber aestivum TaxID=59557 RepID=A0A292PYE3_9PEZI|nr:unnamed protein product [Tuber aestivum]
MQAQSLSASAKARSPVLEYRTGCYFRSGPPGRAGRIYANRIAKANEADQVLEGLWGKLWVRLMGPRSAEWGLGVEEGLEIRGEERCKVREEGGGEPKHEGDEVEEGENMCLYELDNVGLEVAVAS